GVKHSDIILSVNGRPVEGTSSLPAMISVLKPGSNVEMEVWRDGKLRNIVAKVVEAQDDGSAQAPRATGSRGDRGGAAPSGEDAVLGLWVRPLTAQERGAIDTEGNLVVERVTSPAEEKGLQPGDIVLSVGSTDVKTKAELQAAVKSAPAMV